MGFPGIMDEEHDSQKVGKGMLESFSSPSTLPHLLLLIFASSSLYGLMKIDLLGLEDRGSTIFLSLCISYCFVALLTPTKIGSSFFRVNHDGKGIFNTAYWSKTLVTMTPILILVLLFSGTIFLQVESENLEIVTKVMALLFVLMSIGQGFSLAFGGVVYARKNSKNTRKGGASAQHTAFRSLAVLLLFSPLVWWFGYDAGDIASGDLSDHFVWGSFLLLIASFTALADRLTAKKRSSDNIDGVIVDRMVLSLSAVACWHLLSAWRRNPLIVDSSTAMMLVEEAFLTAITIFLAVWSMSNRGSKNGWKIFQGQSAIYWGIAFGYAYGGSIASLTALSEGNLLSTMAGGHLLTALVLLGIMPIAVSRVGNIPTKEHGDLESSGLESFSESSNQKENTPSMNDYVNSDESAESTRGQEKSPVIESETFDDGDVIELLD